MPEPFHQQESVYARYIVSKMRMRRCDRETCRRQSGHYVAASRINAQGLQLIQADQLKWWAASQSAKRGFCSDCGSLMFWRENGSDEVSIFMGCIDAPTGITLTKHIFVSEKGDYYDL